MVAGIESMVPHIPESRCPLATRDSFASWGKKVMIKVKGRDSIIGHKWYGILLKYIGQLQDSWFIVLPFLFVDLCLFGVTLDCAQGLLLVCAQESFLLNFRETISAPGVGLAICKKCIQSTLLALQLHNLTNFKITRWV